MINELGNATDFKSSRNDCHILSDGPWQDWKHWEDVFNDLIGHNVDDTVAGDQIIDDPTATIDSCSL